MPCLTAVLDTSSPSAVSLQGLTRRHSSYSDACRSVHGVRVIPGLALVQSTFGVAVPALSLSDRFPVSPLSGKKFHKCLPAGDVGDVAEIEETAGPLSARFEGSVS